ncbi:restriction endonuclease [Virgibacillus doumboii]|uniref:restriction endonuclease n=1 Tax=Virgibacillus doumboii TaxID=2697503 RepID=UPI0013E0886F|nr:restriction endonuclease [Virgibacillus doumboii]
MNRGYAGYYKDYYLRSSYEYAYAKYLDYYSIPWTYELKTFDIGYRKYKPDFFLFGQKNNISNIVEIKSREKYRLLEARKALGAIEELYAIDCELISYNELLTMYKKLPFSLTSTITEWIKSEVTTINKAAYGKLNGHYNIPHTLEAKKKIGEHTKKLWATDNETKKRMIEGLRKSGSIQKGKLKKPRETRNCAACGTAFNIIITSNKKYCSRKCAGNIAIKNATNIYVIKRGVIHEEIKQYIIEWSISHKEIVLTTKLNKIKPTLKPLFEDINTKFGVKDFRVISKAVFGKDRGRKELVRFMKKLCNEKVC